MRRTVRHAGMNHLPITSPLTGPRNVSEPLNPFQTLRESQESETVFVDLGRSFTPGGKGFTLLGRFLDDHQKVFQK